MIFIIILTLLFAAVILYVLTVENNKAKYWSSKRVAHVKHKFIMGILWDYIVQDGSLGDVYESIYRMFPNLPYVGAFVANQPNLIIRDPKIIQHVLQTEFQSFLSRGVNVNWEVDKLADNVLFMEGVRWKIMRQKLTPVFTSGKLKNMFSIMDQSGREFEKIIDTMKSEEHSLMDVISTFTTSSIGASVFGIDTKPNINFDSPLQKMAREANNPKFLANMKFALNSFFPKLFTLLKIKIFGDHEQLFIGVVKNVLKTRKQQGLKRHDFIDTLLDIQKEEKLRDVSSGYEIETTDELMAAQAFFFFIAGVDPTASAIHFTLFELSKNPKILEKLLVEVDTTVVENGCIITYDSMEKMHLLDMVLSESLRMYPPIGHIQRKCVMENILPDGLKIDRGVTITIPVQAIHRDPNFYPNPENFCPERFASKTNKERPNYTFLPFGEGNRMCIGMRFARLQAKIGLLHILRGFTVQSTAAAGGAAGEGGWFKFDKTFFNSRATNLQYKLVKRLK